MDVVWENDQGFFGPFCITSRPPNVRNPTRITRRFKISNILYTHVYLVYMEDIWLHHRTHLGSAELSPKLSRSALTFDDKNIQN